jgi:hypothetical protein
MKKYLPKLGYDGESTDKDTTTVNATTVPELRI